MQGTDVTLTSRQPGSAEHTDPFMTSMSPSVLVFDVNETLIDIDAMTPLFAQIFGDPRAMREWFAQLVTYSMTTAISHHYVDFFTLGQAALRMLADIHGVHITDDDLHRIRDAMLTMPAHPDVADALTELRDNGFRLVTLTNSPPNPHGQSPLEHAGLGGFFERQFSVDACRTYKPDPAVYRHVCQELAVAPSECMMVAAHVWDTIGAQSIGFSAALVTRSGNAPLLADGLPQPTIVVSDLHQLAQQLDKP
jgi:2-haloacid dehalogenase